MFSVYVNFPDEKSARGIARKLVKEQLIACANLFPVHSIYNWKGKLVEANEWTMIAKCARAKIKKAEARILALHPDEIPAIVWHEEKATAAYAKWAEGRR